MATTTRTIVGNSLTLRNFRLWGGCFMRQPPFSHLVLSSTSPKILRGIVWDDFWDRWRVAMYLPSYTYTFLSASYYFCLASNYFFDIASNSWHLFIWGDNGMKHNATCNIVDVKHSQIILETWSTQEADKCKGRHFRVAISYMTSLSLVILRK